MPSTDELIAQLSQLEDLLQKLHKQTAEVKAVRGNMSTAAGQLASAAEAIQQLADMMTEAAKTMRELDMESVLGRVDSLENRIVERSTEFADLLRASMADLSNSLNATVGDLLGQMPSRIGPVIEATLADTTKAITDSNARMTKTLEANLETVLADAATSVKTAAADSERYTRTVSEELVREFVKLSDQLKDESALRIETQSRFDKIVQKHFSDAQKQNASLKTETVEAVRVILDAGRQNQASTRRWAQLTFFIVVFLSSLLLFINGEAVRSSASSILKAATGESKP